MAMDFFFVGAKVFPLFSLCVYRYIKICKNKKPDKKKSASKYSNCQMMCLKTHAPAEHYLI
jgi:hypothetical protein